MQQYETDIGDRFHVTRSAKNGKQTVVLYENANRRISNEIVFRDLIIIRREIVFEKFLRSHSIDVNRCLRMIRQFVAGILNLRFVTIVYSLFITQKSQSRFGKEFLIDLFPLTVRTNLYNSYCHNNYGLFSIQVTSKCLNMINHDAFPDNVLYEEHEFVVPKISKITLQLD